MIVLDAPPQPPPVALNPVCIVVASAWYNVPSESMLVLRLTEGGKVGTLSRNTNASIDHGPNQINTINLPKFARYGITAGDITYNECINTAAAAYILRENLIQRRGNIWEAMMDYNSRTPSKRARYLNLMSGQYAKLQRGYSRYLEWLRQQTLKYRKQVPPEILKATPDLTGAR